MFEIRRADDNDFEALASIHLASLVQVMPFMPRIHTVEEDRKYFANILASQECWVAEIERIVLGFIAFRDSWVNHLYVLPDYQGIGVGSKLLGIAKEVSLPFLQLWTFQANNRARAFYMKHGFVEVELTDGAGNEEGTPDVRLVWNSPSLRLHPSG